VQLIVTAGYRSDAEQAKLYAAHPDPRWVAPPGKSLHRWGTELDLGPRSAYGSLARNADRVHFVQRYNHPYRGFRSGSVPLPAMRVDPCPDTGIGKVVRVLQVEPIDGDPVPAPKRKRRVVTAPAWRADEAESVEQRERSRR
jgi:hypothetical protein